MRIEGMDASSVAYTKAKETNIPNTDNVRESKTDTKENINASQLTELEKKELPISDKVVIDAIEKANKVISGANREFEFSIHKKTKEIMVKVIDSNTKEVIREIPPEKILDMVAKMWEMAGIIIDERR